MPAPGLADTDFLRTDEAEVGCDALANDPQLWMPWSYRDALV
jgi:hypothetical protein